MKFKTVILYNERRIRPQTIKAIEEAVDGALIPVDVSELDSFVPLLVPVDDSMSAPAKKGGGK